MKANDALMREFRSQVEASIDAKRRLLTEPDACIAVAKVLIKAYRGGHALLLFGNGGSAADAQHIAAEFLGRFNIERPGMAAHALTVNTSALTAISNDYEFDEVFARQVRAIGRPGDVAVGISTSGNTPNVVRGLAAAREGGLVSVGLTGARGGRLRETVDFWVGVPSDETPRIQEAHIMIGHIWSAMVEAALFGPPAS